MMYAVESCTGIIVASRETGPEPGMYGAGIAGMSMAMCAERRGGTMGAGAAVVVTAGFGGLGASEEGVEDARGFVWQLMTRRAA